MIWTLARIDESLLHAFTPAGSPDQSIIDAYVQKHGQHRPGREGIKRYYYLLIDNPRIRLTTVGMPLENWQGAAKVIVGTSTILGEFVGNRDFTGLQGLQLKMEPIAWLHGQADKELQTGQELLAELSEQILDQKAIERSQERIKQVYKQKRS